MELDKEKVYLLQSARTLTHVGSPKLELFNLLKDLYPDSGERIRKTDSYEELKSYAKEMYLKMLDEFSCSEVAMWEGSSLVWWKLV